MIHATVDESLTSPSQPFRRELTYSPDQLAPLRMLVRARLRVWNLEALVPNAWVIVTELCSNVRHTGDPRYELTMRPLDAGVRIEVRDGSTSLPVIPTSPPALEEGNGRGLLLVRSHATRVGVAPTEDGKVMWAELVIDVSPQAAC